jgi:uncharacterized membrane protein
MDPQVEWNRIAVLERAHAHADRVRKERRRKNSDRQNADAVRELALIFGVGMATIAVMAVATALVMYTQGRLP